MLKSINENVLRHAEENFDRHAEAGRAYIERFGEQFFALAENIHS